MRWARMPAPTSRQTAIAEDPFSLLRPASSSSVWLRSLGESWTVGETLASAAETQQPCSAPGEKSDSTSTQATNHLPDART